MLNYIHWDVISWMLMFNSQIVAVFSAALQPKKMRGGHGDETQALNYGSRTLSPLYDHRKSPERHQKENEGFSPCGLSACIGRHQSREEEDDQDQFKGADPP